MDLNTLLGSPGALTQALDDVQWDRWLAATKPCGHPLRIGQLGAVITSADEHTVTIWPCATEDEATFLFASAMVSASMLTDTPVTCGGTPVPDDILMAAVARTGVPDSPEGWSIV